MRNKTLFYIMPLIVMLVSLLLVLYYRYHAQRFENMAKGFFDYQSKQLYKNIDDAKNSSLALAVLLGENDYIIDCYQNSDRKECLKNINTIISNLNSVVMYKNLKFHLHTKDIKSLVRSWNNSRYGDDLFPFRHIIHEVANSSKPVSGIESGMAGTFIRAAASVQKKGQILGSVEVMLDFEYISNFFKDQGIDLFVLLDKQKNQPRYKMEGDDIMRDYFISNYKSANLNLVPILEQLKLNDGGFQIYNSHYFCIVPMFNYINKHIGYYVLHINSDFKDKNIFQERLFLNPLF
ncbi:cache domain-containing protein [Campylobacter mucosalis]|uniref:cache domain-containing protein n=1 Tax=Campylobacter mucosalis TaxID=202 RepID=UPI001470456B|nr:cache domain-containing protein [Campylobacter mucosalis]